MVRDAYFIGTDIGTLGTKTIIVNLSGNIVSHDFEEYEIITPKPLWAEQWPDIWFKAVCNTVKNALHKKQIPPSSIKGLCISGLYGGSGIPCDNEMNPLRPCIIWMDRRATDEVEWVGKNIGKEELFKITGNYLDTFYGFSKILWIKNKEPEIWKKIAHLVTPHAYVIYKLTGCLSMDYSSAGIIGGIFDINKRDWSQDLLNAMEIPRKFFLENLSESSDVVGKINRKGSELIGLLEGTPVCAGGIDAAVATLSAGAFDIGEHVAMIGTSMCWGVINPGDKFSPFLTNFPHVVYSKEKIYSFAGTLTAGAIVKWFRDQFGLVEKTFDDLINIDAYALLDLEASSVTPGSNRLIVLPYFMGERAPLWNVNARGTIVGLTLYHTKAHIYRAYLEAVAYALRNCIEFGKSLNMKLKKDMIMVGGATKSLLWKKIFSDVTNFPVLCVTGGGEAAYGDALLAAYGQKAVNNYETIKDWLSFDEPIKPDKKNVEIYDAYYYQYVEVYESLKKSMDNLTLLH